MVAIELGPSFSGMLYNGEMHLGNLADNLHDGLALPNTDDSMRRPARSAGGTFHGAQGAGVGARRETFRRAPRRHVPSNADKYV